MDRFHFLDLLPISLALVASGTWFALSWGSPPKPPPDSLAHAMELHVALDPVHVAPLRVEGIMVQPQDGSYLIQELRRAASSSHP